MDLLCRRQLPLFMHCSSTVYIFKNIKMDPTVLFTYLKIILLQCFQFLVSTKISCIQLDPEIAFHICVSFFFFLMLHTHLGGQRLLFMLPFMNSSSSLLTFQPFYQSCGSRALTHKFHFLVTFFIKNRSYGTIHTFKNYFATMFSVFNFSKISSIQTDPAYKLFLSNFLFL